MNTPVATLLELVEALDPSGPNPGAAANYEARNRTVLIAAGVAAKEGMEVGISIDPTEPDWPVLYIELPTGQVSWHLAKHQKKYDGHSTAEKYNRITRWADSVHHKPDSAGGGFRTRLDDRGYSTTEPRNADSVLPTVCTCKFDPDACGAHRKPDSVAPAFPNICPNCHATLTGCNASGCGQRQQPGWRDASPGDDEDDGSDYFKALDRHDNARWDDNGQL
jgi:hypothetical protein